MSLKSLILLPGIAACLLGTATSAGAVQARQGASPFPPATGTLPIMKTPTLSAAEVQARLRAAPNVVANAPARTPVIAPALAAGSGLKPYAGR